MESIAQRLAGLQAQVTAACVASGRSVDSVRLIAVSKLQPVQAMTEVLKLGQLDFGENYAQELRDKAQELQALPEAAQLRWHFIGPLQRNKAALVVGRASLIHSVDSLSLIAELASRAKRVRVSKPTFCQDCLIQVDLAAEPQKAGCSPEEVPALLDAISGADGLLRCCGLMCIPPAVESAEDARPYFRRLRQLLQELAHQPRPHVELTELSMGMSQDFQVAISEGATLVRVGTALFGARPPR